MAPIIQSVIDCIAMIDGHVLSESQTLLRNNRRDYITVELLMRPLPVSNFITRGQCVTFLLICLLAVTL